MYQRNAYPEFSKFEVELVRNVARRMVGHYGFTANDVEDIEQELMTHIWKKKHLFNPRHESNSSYETFITKVVEKKKLSMFRKKERERKDIDAPDSDYLEELLFSENSQSFLCDGNVSPETIVVYRDTLRSAIRELTPQLKIICQLLAEGFQPYEIADELGVSKTAVHRRMEKIRQCFLGAGLDECLV